MSAPFSLSGVVPIPSGKQPRCITGYDENRITVGFVNGEIASFERPDLSQQFTLAEDSTHKVSQGIIFGMNQVPEGHEMLTETSLLIAGGDKALRNVLSDGTELFAVSPLTHPDMAHTATVENIVIANDTRQTLITAGWDGQVKFWSGDECIMSLGLKNQYSTQIALIGNDKLVVGSGSKIISFILINFEKLYTLFAQRQAESIANNSKMDNDDEFDDFSMNDGNNQNQTLKMMNPIITDQIAINSEVISYLDFKDNAHDHAIRRIIPLYRTIDNIKQHQTDIIASIGNDGHCKVWNISNNKLEKLIEIEVLQSQGDQSEFLYDIIQFYDPLNKGGNGNIIVSIAGDDRTIRQINISSALSPQQQQQEIAAPIPSSMLTSAIVAASYHSPFEIQCVELPAVPRSLYRLDRSTDSNNTTAATTITTTTTTTSSSSSDFVTVTPGGVYTFSYEKSRWSDQTVIETFNATIQANIEKAKKMSNIDLETLPQADSLFKAGEKDGQHKIVNINGKSMVVQWSNERYEWVLIGEAVGSNNAEGQGNKKEYKGKFYDHVVDVDAGAATKLILAFNSDDDPYDVAQAFIIEHQLDVGATMQIVQFILPYIDQKKLQRRKEAAELAKLQQLSEFSQATWGYSTRSTINNVLIQNAMSKRIQGFATTDPSKLWPGATGVIATDKIFAHLCWVTQQAPMVQPEAVLNAKDLEALTIMLSTWPADNLTPVLDIIRVLSYEATANNVIFNPTSPGFDSTFNSLLLSKLTTTFLTSLSSTTQNGFASLSLILDIFSHAIGRRTNIRQLTAQFDLFDNALPQLYNIITGSSPDNGGSTLSTFVTTFPSNGFKLMPSIYRVIHNVTSFCNRVGMQPIQANAPPQTAQLPDKISSTIEKWLSFFVSLLDKIPVPTNGDGSWEKDTHMYESIIDCCKTIAFECDCYVKLKQNFITNYSTLFTKTLPKSLSFYRQNIAKTRDDQNHAVALVRDFDILFKGPKA